ncbi:hypothetical protein TNCV_1410231 [Trichonephila clavipes]|nr:hypothetical protein TNCV_1410231 [Trichonephila clavipes]
MIRMKVLDANRLRAFSLVSPNADTFPMMLHAEPRIFWTAWCRSYIQLSHWPRNCHYTLLCCRINGSRKNAHHANSPCCFRRHPTVNVCTCRTDNKPIFRLKVRHGAVRSYKSDLTTCRMGVKSLKVSDEVRNRDFAKAYKRIIFMIFSVT